MSTYAQHSIKHCLDMIAPFEASDEQRKAGQAQFYEFMVSIYQEMYEKPDDYLVFPMPYETYIAKRKQKDSEHASDSRESTLRNTFQQAIQFYALYFDLQSDFPHMPFQAHLPAKSIVLIQPVSVPRNPEMHKLKLSPVRLLHIFSGGGKR